MNAKEWLSRARNIDIEIKALEEQKAILFTELTKCTSPTDVERVKNSKTNTREEKQIKYADLCSKIEKLINNLSDIKSEIINAISEVPDGMCRTLLYERYINYKKWHQIANRINYSESHTKYVLHNIALRYIKT